MSTSFQSELPLSSEEREALLNRISDVFRPGSPIDEARLFAGRINEIQQTRTALERAGNHAIIFGERGVGKTSLANEIVRRLREDGVAISSRVECERSDTYADLWQRALNGITIQREVVVLDRREAINENARSLLPENPQPSHVSGVLKQRKTPPSLIVVFDELDRLESKDARKLIADTIKTFSDDPVGAKLLLVGVAETVDQLLEEHASVDRSMVQVSMPRMSPEEIAQIVSASSLLGIGVEEDALKAIVSICQGLPHFAHLLGELTTRVAIRAGSRAIRLADVQNAIPDALKNAQHTLVESYEDATFEDDGRYARLLLACARAKTDPFGRFTARAVHTEYVGLDETASDSEAVLASLRELTSADRGSILRAVSTKQRFRFSSALMPPYVVMRAAERGWLTADLRPVARSIPSSALITADEPASETLDRGRQGTLPFVKESTRELAGSGGALILEGSDHISPGRWRWSLRDPSGREIDSYTVELDPGSARFRKALRLGALLDGAARSNTAAAYGERLMVEVGEWIARDVLGPFAAAIARHRVVRVIVPVGASELFRIPLEAALVDGISLAGHGVTFIYDTEESETTLAPRPVDGRLRILAIFGAPLHDSLSNGYREQQSLRALINALQDTRGAAIDLQMMQAGMTRRTLNETLRAREGWDVVHIVAHDLSGLLAVEDERGEIDIIDPHELAALLRFAQRRLKLITFIASKASGADAMEDVGEGPPLAFLSAVSRSLHCAVVSSRYPLDEDVAISFVQTLYEQLCANGAPLSTAFSYAVRTLATEERSRGPALTAIPILFGSDVNAEALAAPTSRWREPSGLALAYFPPEPVTFVGRSDTLRRASSTLAPQSGRNGVLLTGFAGIGKTSCALLLAHQYQAVERFQGFVWFSVPVLDSMIPLSLRNFALSVERQLAEIAPNFGMVDVVDDINALSSWLHVFDAFIERTPVLFVIDAVEGLLTPDGRWRDDRWRLVVEAIMHSPGTSRIIMTSRSVPDDLPQTIETLSLRALTAAEARAFVQQLPRLRALSGSRSGGRTGTELLTRVLQATAGHPKLLLLMDQIAKDPSQVAERLEAIDRLALAPRSETFGWFVLGSLRTSAKTSLTVLSCITATDRHSAILHAVWPMFAEVLPLDHLVPDAETALQELVEAGVVERRSESDGSSRYLIDRALEDAASDATDTELRSTVAETMSHFWTNFLIRPALKSETSQPGAPLTYVTSAFPYLLQRRDWELASNAIQAVYQADDSPATIAALIPLARIIADATRAPLHLLSLAVLYADERRYDKASTILEEALTAAAEAGSVDIEIKAHTLAARIESTIERYAKAIDHLEAARQLALRTGKEHLEISAQALGVMLAAGRYEDVLKNIGPLVDRVAHEGGAGSRLHLFVLKLGRTAAIGSELWDKALEFGLLLENAMREGRVSEPEYARALLDDVMPMMALGRFREADDVLMTCRRIAEDTNDLPLLQNVFRFSAYNAALIGDLYGAVSLASLALRYAYTTKDLERIALSHVVLSQHLRRSGGDAGTIASHMIAALFVSHMMGGDSEHIVDLREFRRSMKPADERALPRTFEALRAAVASDGTDLEGVLFAGGLDPRQADALVERIVAESAP